MKIKLCYLFLGLFIPVQVLLAQNTEKVRVKVRISNSVDGAEIKNPKVNVSYVLSENTISLTTEKKNTFYEIVKGAEIKVSAEAFQYYAEEKRFNTDQLYDDDVLEIRLNPRPAGNAVVAVLDAKTKQPIPARVEISFAGTKNAQNTVPGKNELEIYFERNGKYTFVAQSEGYSLKEVEKDLTVGGKVSRIVIELDKAAVQQKIIAKDKNSRAAIEAIDKAEVVHTANKKAVAWQATDMSFPALPGESYTLSFEKDGYEPLKTQITADGNPKEIYLEPKKLAPFLPVVENLVTMSKVASELEVISPSGASEFIVAHKQFFPKELGEYSFLFKKDGFSSATMKLNSRYLTETPEVRVLLEVTSPTKVSIAVLDSTSGQPVMNATTRLFNEKAKDLQGTQNRNTSEFTVMGKQTLFYEISAPGYHDRTGNIEVANIAEIGTKVFLSKKVIENFQEHEYSFIDAHSKEPVKKAQLLILDENKKSVETLFNSAKGTYLTYKINPEKAYTIQILAEGYKEVNTTLVKGPRNISLELEPSQLEETVISVYDQYTREMLTISSITLASTSGNAIELKYRNREYVAALKKNVSYTVRFKERDYPSFEKEFKINALNSNKIDIFIRKNAYPLALIIQNQLTDEQKDKAQAEITYLSGTVLQNTFEKASKSFLVDSDPNETLQVEINVPGFRTYKASNNRKQLALYEIKVELEPIPEPVAEAPEVKAPEPPIVTELVKVEEPVKKEEPEVKTVVKTEQPMEPTKGKRFQLDGVNFEQSKTAMLPGSELKLNELLKFMTDNPNVKIEVIGHTDKIGDERQNKRLSEFRARTVASWLFNKGIDSQRISTTGKGSAEPLAANDSEETKAQNRRIEVYVLED